MPVQSVIMGVTATHHAAFERIGTHTLIQVIPEIQKARLNCLFYQQRFFVCLFIFQIVPIMQSEGEEL